MQERSVLWTAMTGVCPPDRLVIVRLARKHYHVQARRGSGRRDLQCELTVRAWLTAICFSFTMNVTSNRCRRLMHMQ